MRTRSFMQVDVFTDTPFLGNPVAVVLEADDLDTDQMQRIARWTNLSETTFVQTATEPAADYRLRIFTPMAELPFAGHPTLGSAHALLQAGCVTPRAGRLVQQCAAGLVPIRVDPDTSRLWLSMPSARFAPVADEDQRLLERIVGGSFASPARLVDVGPRWIVAAYGSTQTLLEVTPDLQTLSALSERLHATGLTMFSHADSSGGSAAPIEVRSWAPAHGIPEDPVCGSGNGSVAAYRAAQGHGVPYVARQGRAIGRDGWVRITYAGDTIEVGGDSVVCVRGKLLA